MIVWPEVISTFFHNFGVLIITKDRKWQKIILEWLEVAFQSVSSEWFDIHCVLLSGFLKMYRVFHEKVTKKWLCLENDVDLTWSYQSQNAFDSWYFGQINDKYSVIHLKNFKSVFLILILNTLYVEFYLHRKLKGIKYARHVFICIVC